MVKFNNHKYDIIIKYTIIILVLIIIVLIIIIKVNHFLYFIYYFIFIKKLLDKDTSNILFFIFKKL